MEWSDTEHGDSVARTELHMFICVRADDSGVNVIALVLDATETRGYSIEEFIGAGASLATAKGIAEAYADAADEAAARLAGEWCNVNGARVRRPYSGAPHDCRYC